MAYIPMILSLTLMLIYYYEALNFTGKILLKPSGKKLYYIVFAVLNTAVHYIFYMINVPPSQTFLFIGILLFFEFLVIAKSNLRQLCFGTSIFAFNIMLINTLVLICFSHSMQIPPTEIFQRQALYFKSLFISYLLLLIALKIVAKLVPMDKLKGMSITKAYAEVVTVTAAIMTLYIYIVRWIMFTDELYSIYLLSVIVGATVFGISFYCLFFFNVHLITLHNYKRKSDKADIIHKKSIEKQHKAEQKLYTDNLTSLYNKRFIDQKLDEFCNQNKFDFAVVYCDLASLKYVNDNFGHSAGDSYIITVANSLKKSVRSDDFVARIGGDEFLVLLYMITESDLETIISRMRTNIKNENIGSEFKIHANIGYTLAYHNKERLALELLRRADMLMQEDKRNYYAMGGGNLCLF